MKNIQKPWFIIVLLFAVLAGVELFTCYQAGVTFEKKLRDFNNELSSKSNEPNSIKLTDLEIERGLFSSKATAKINIFTMASTNVYSFPISVQTTQGLMPNLSVLRANWTMGVPSDPELQQIFLKLNDTQPLSGNLQFNISGELTLSETKIAPAHGKISVDSEDLSFDWDGANVRIENANFYDNGGGSIKINSHFEPIKLASSTQGSAIQIGVLDIGQKTTGFVSSNNSEINLHLGKSEFTFSNLELNLTNVDLKANIKSRLDEVLNNKNVSGLDKKSVFIDLQTFQISLGQPTGNINATGRFDLPLLSTQDQSQPFVILEKYSQQSVIDLNLSGSKILMQQFLGENFLSQYVNSVEPNGDVTITINFKQGHLTVNGQQIL